MDCASLPNTYTIFLSFFKFYWWNNYTRILWLTLKWMFTLWMMMISSGWGASAGLIYFGGILEMICSSLWQEMEESCWGWAIVTDVIFQQVLCSFKSFTFKSISSHLVENTGPLYKGLMNQIHLLVLLGVSFIWPYFLLFLFSYAFYAKWKAPHACFLSSLFSIWIRSYWLSEQKVQIMLFDLYEKWWLHLFLCTNLKV